MSWATVMAPDAAGSTGLATACDWAPATCDAAERVSARPAAAATGGRQGARARQAHPRGAVPRVVIPNRVPRRGGGNGAGARAPPPSGDAVARTGTAEKGGQIGEGTLAHGDARLDGRAAQVRQQHEIGELEHLPPRTRLVGEHVQGGTGDRSRAESGDEGRLIDDVDARSVDEAGVPRH